MPDADGRQRLEKVRRSLLHMVSPAGFGDDSSRSFGTLTALNVPPWLARADAAFCRAVQLLTTGDGCRAESSADPSVRLAYWHDVRRLLREAEENLASIAHVFEDAEDSPLNVSLYLAYTRFLLRVSAQAEAAVLSRFELPDDAQSFTLPLFPPDFQTQIAGADKLFSSAESGTCGFLLGCLKSSASALEQIRAQGRNVLPKVGQERYDRAFAAFSAHFSHIGEASAT